MSRASQETLRRMVSLNPVAYNIRGKQLQHLHQPDYSIHVDPSRFAPPYPGPPEWGCLGCEFDLPWHTSFAMKDAQGRATVVDAHECFGPEPLTEKGKPLAAQTFSQLLALQSRQQ